MYRIFFLTLLFALASKTSLYSQTEYGNRNMVKQSIFIPNFHRIEAYGDFTIILKEDSVNSLVLVTDENNISDINIKSVDDKLVIKDLNQVNASSCQLYLHYNMLKSVELFGSVYLEDDLLCTFDTLTLSLNGDSSAKLQLQAKGLEVKQSTNSKLSLIGQSNHAKYELNQNTELNTIQFDCLNSYIELFDNSKANMIANYNFIGFLNDLSALNLHGKSNQEQVSVGELCRYKRH